MKKNTLKNFIINNFSVAYLLTYALLYFTSLFTQNSLVKTIAAFTLVLSFLFTLFISLYMIRFKIFRKTVFINLGLLISIFILFSFLRLYFWNAPQDISASAVREKLFTVILSFFYILVFTALALGILQWLTGIDFKSGEKREAKILHLVFKGFFLLTVLVFINLAANRLPFLIDLSGPGRYTLSPMGKDAIRSIKSDVSIIAFYPFFHDYHKEIELMLKSIQSVNSQITYKMVDALRDREIAEENKIDRNGWVVIKTREKPKNKTSEKIDAFHKERKIAIRSNDDLRRMEQDFVTSIIAVTGKRKQVYFTSGSGEITSQESFVEDSISRFYDSLRQNNYSANDLSQAKSYPQSIPKDAAALMVIGPDKRLPLDARKAIYSYVKKGGALFLALEPLNSGVLPEMEKEFGIKYNGGKLLSEHFLKPYKNMLVITDYSAGPVTGRLINLPLSERFVVFNGSGYFQSVKNQNDKPMRIGFPALTSARSWLDTFADNERNENEPFNSFNVMASIEIGDEDSGGRGKVIAFGDADFLRNRYIDYGKNFELALTSVEWLTDKASISQRLPPVYYETRIKMKGTTDDIVFYTLVYIWPAVLFLFGFIYIKQRNPKEKKIEKNEKEIS